jgi:aminopeptidase N
LPTRDPHSYADPTQGRIRHVELRIATDFAARALRIHADYHLDRPVVGPLDLDCRGLEILQVRAGGQRVRFELAATDPVLGERLRLPDLRGHERFSVDLTTSAHASALQWLEPRHTSAGRHPFLYSQCEPLHARSIFPCQDTPGVRFTYDAHLTVPRGLTALMAADPRGHKRLGPDVTFSFRMPQPIPSYLFALAVGELEFRRLGPRTGIYAEPPLLEAAAWEFAENEAKLAAAESLFGPYRWDRYDLLVMPPSFPINGMENPRLTFVTPLVVLGDRSRTVLVSHELAHAWTGNLVTNATWDDLWLNEGWTTYADTRITELVEGPEISGLFDLLLLDVLREDVRTFGADSPHTCLKTSLAGIDPDEVFSRVPYMKGMLFVLSLERAVGRERFDAFVRRYIDDFAFQSLSTEEFVAYLRRELPIAAAQVDLERWLYQPGLPARLPELSSCLYDEVSRAATAYPEHGLPPAAILSGWHPSQTMLFLRLLPPSIPLPDCETLDAAMAFATTRHTNPLFEFLRLAVRSGYAQVMPTVERFVETVGNEYQLRRVFRCLAETDWSRAAARPLFERVRHRHHPITATLVDRTLTELGV